MALRIAAAVIAFILGGWMAFDGMHVIVRGKYVGPPTPGPWRLAFERIGVDVFRLGPMFVAFGCAWLACAGGLAAGQRWGWYGGIAVAVASLWYLPLGTVLSVIFLAVAVAGRSQFGG